MRGKRSAAPPPRCSRSAASPLAILLGLPPAPLPSFRPAAGLLPGPEGPPLPPLRLTGKRVGVEEAGPPPPSPLPLLSGRLTEGGGSASGLLASKPPANFGSGLCCGCGAPAGASSPSTSAASDSERLRCCGGCVWGRAGWSGGAVAMKRLGAFPGVIFLNKIRAVRIVPRGRGPASFPHLAACCSVDQPFLLLLFSYDLNDMANLFACTR